MAQKFIGAQIRAGEFTDKDTGKLIQYNNLVLHTVEPANCGEICVDPVKITNTGDNILKVFGTKITMTWLRERLGWYVDIFYNKYKKVDRVIFYQENPQVNENAYNEAFATKNYTAVTDDTAQGMADDAGVPDYPFDA